MCTRAVNSLRAPWNWGFCLSQKRRYKPQRGGRSNARSSDQAAAGLPVFMIGTLAGTVIFTWLFNNTRGSVLLVMLFHSFINMWIEVFPAQPLIR
jgi:membrane protease YdiL (CAAX protease family)